MYYDRERWSHAAQATQRDLAKPNVCGAFRVRARIAGLDALANTQQLHGHPPVPSDTQTHTPCMSYTAPSSGSTGASGPKPDPPVSHGPSPSPISVAGLQKRDQLCKELRQQLRGDCAGDFGQQT
jgi:hypothetical protein